MFIFDLLYEYTENLLPPLAAGITAAGSTYIISNAAINSIPNFVKEGGKLITSGLAGVVAVVAIAETASIAAVVFAIAGGTTYGTLVLGGEKIQKISTATTSIAVGAVTTSLMSGRGLFFADYNSLASAPYSSSAMPDTQHVEL